MKHLFLLLSFSCAYVCAQTISEKRIQIEQATSPLDEDMHDELKHTNRDLKLLREQLKSLINEARRLHKRSAPLASFEELLDEIHGVRREIRKTEETWRSRIVDKGNQEEYALWHQPWTSVEQLVMDFGSDQYVYLIPPEVGGIRLTVASNLPVPKESWDEMLQLILMQNGVAMRQANPLLRELYLVADKPELASYVTADRFELDSYPSAAQVCFILSPGSSRLTTTQQFFERFLDPLQSSIHRVNNFVLILSNVSSLQEVLKIYDFVEGGPQIRGYELVALHKISGQEMEELLHVHFGELVANGAEERFDPPLLKTLAPQSLPFSLFLAGPREVLSEAKEIIRHVEEQIQDTARRELIRYKVKHSDPEELATILDQVYALLLENPGAAEDALEQAFHLEDSPTNLPIHPQPISSGGKQEKQETMRARGNFVVSLKTNTIIMVIEKDFTNPIKQLLQKLDVPKKMVKIDVLLFEKRIDDTSRFGLNFLGLGSLANNAHNRIGLTFGNPGGSDRVTGIVQFLVNAVKSPITPAFDFVYNFLMGRDDVRIHSHPTITTVNNTPAKIELMDEISIDTGSVTNADGELIGKSFARQQYGIALTITPTVNDGDEGEDFITLETDVLFDTILTTGVRDRPPILRRHITNQVRIADGQTVVMGGLRSKDEEDSETGLPFLSEIPYFGKFFGHTELRDRDREMYIFITPHIIDDTAEEFYRFKQEAMSRRPGDIPEFLRRMEEAKQKKQQRLCERTLRTLLKGPLS